jgi:hypothetical protein
LPTRHRPGTRRSWPTPSVDALVLEAPSAGSSTGPSGQGLDRMSPGPRGVATQTGT